MSKLRIASLHTAKLLFLTNFSVESMQPRLRVEEIGVSYDKLQLQTIGFNTFIFHNLLTIVYYMLLYDKWTKLARFHGVLRCDVAGHLNLCLLSLALYI
jgi:hypothetical protein